MLRLKLLEKILWAFCVGQKNPELYETGPKMLFFSSLGSEAGVTTLLGKDRSGFKIDGGIPWSR